ncbi:cytochrome-c oxidase, cbb3-type subunit III [Pelagovum pacificum]|uniref:Cbb3-type cytochrome c oxidase subunit n=1 Tax=Pelagovum pacificum TaxID=2588711 RepID=A0A5C5GH91_9RHOB|nr:cytochrome-c oxidase, cbb3-type subunit III [Pelagovum pacificum]QQA42714.1 cytochrome-c oxidase, cbb3-type subunit III [Pelagovum pacificum]TNY34135.1 cytochrome-c oxidase, cbb3-type subunit III [Pelagovum pacificum]
MSDKVDIYENDPDTTGHEWDGIKEFDNPLPRWWLWIFYATIVWGIIYTILYPAWPLVNRATGGLLDYSTRNLVAEQIATVDERNADLVAALSEADLTTLAENGDLHGFAVNMGAAVFRSKCSQCHGSGAGGAVGFPNLNDDAWLWGGQITEIAETIANGVRNEDSPAARWSEMPAFGRDGLLDREQVSAVVQHVLAISGQEHDAELAEAGATVFADNCVACHSDDGTGDQTMGAPNLTDAIWLYGGSEAAITETVNNARFGVMPAWSEEFRSPGLTDAEINAAAAYVHQLGGGQ